MAREAGAVGFLIAGPVAGACVAGSSGRDGADGIPAAGIAPETAARLARTRAGWPRVTLKIETKEAPAETETLLFDIPGRTDAWVVLSAHVDGHDLAESAIDNATGVAAALAVTRAVAPHIGPLRRGLRVAFFSVEEWALLGSAQYVAGLDQHERDAIALNVNLDSVAGGASLTAMTSGFAGLEPFLLEVAAANGQALRCVRPLMMNSDHGNFAVAGIPALRLVAGYDDPLANTRFVLTPEDTRDKVTRAELAAAAELSAAVIMAACGAGEGEARRWHGLSVAG
jgi:aminopeptidase YwaD